MKQQQTFFFFIVLLALSRSSAFCIIDKRLQAHFVKLPKSQKYASVLNNDIEKKIDSNVEVISNGRRNALLHIRMSFAIAATVISGVLHVPSASAGLLDEYGTDFKTIQPISKPAPTTDEQSSTKTVQIDPTLRGSYYYPTAKKRYLPRIQKVSSELTNVRSYIEAGDWDAIIAFGKTAENAILPLFLYQSSLDGQGLSLSNSYAKEMKNDAILYEKGFKKFLVALNNKDLETISVAVAEMGIAITDYRQQGRLSDDDGYIPSVDEIKRMTMRRPTVKLPTQP